MDSYAVFWWAAIFRTFSSMFDKMLHLSKTQCSTMNSVRSHNFRESISDLLTVSMHLQDSLSRFHRPGLHKIDLRVHVASASTRTLAFHESQRCCAVRAQDNSTRRAIAHLVPLVSRCDTLVSSTNQCQQLGLTRPRANHFLFLGRRTHGIPRVFNGTLGPDSDSRVAATVLDVSSPISFSHHHDRTLRSARNSRNIKIATVTFHAIFPTKYLSKRLMLISSRVEAVPR